MSDHTPKFFYKSSSVSLTTVTLILHLATSHYHSVQASEINSIDPITNTVKIDQTSNSRKKVRIAVLDFDYSSIGNPMFLSFIPGGGKGISDLMVNELVKTGQYSVIERSEIEAILQEQNLGASSRVDATTAANIGRLLGVETVIIGSITQCDLQIKNSGGGVFGTGADVTKVKAYVQLNARLINTTTGEIINVAEGTGKSSQKDTQVRVFGIGGGSSTRNEGKLITQATQQAVDQLVSTINSGNVAKGSGGITSVNAIVADVSGNTIIFNKGTTSGYKTGMKVSIERISKKIKDPETGEVIRTLTQTIGIVELVDVDAKSSLGQVISGNDFEVGDIAKPIN
ncbi:MAG: CsgG/HfaB family protein [Xenococcaceae cyanobacterium MO_188.B19]|nr:CsgG/HfaB family protein [Xenococcaceae cyanobacterium MO_188.B19]